VEPRFVRLKSSGHSGVKISLQKTKRGPITLLQLQMTESMCAHKHTIWLSLHKQSVTQMITKKSMSVAYSTYFLSTKLQRKNKVSWCMSMMLLFLY